MRREIHKWFSPNLNKEMDLVVYGDFAAALKLPLKLWVAERCKPAVRRT